MERILDRKLGAAAALALGLLAINATLAYTNTRNLRDALAWVGHSRSVLLGLSETLAAVSDAETGQRGYLITGNFGYLDPYIAARRTLGEELDSLQRLTADNPAQKERVAAIRRLALARMSRLDTGIRLRQEKGFEAAREEVLSNAGKSEMEALRNAVARTTLEEEALLRDREGAAERSYRIALVTGIVSALSALLAVVALLLLVARHGRAREAAAPAIADQAGQRGSDGLAPRPPPHPRH